MTYELKVIPKPTYLHFVVTGPNTQENVIGYSSAIIQECKERKCFRILIEERLEGPRLPMLDVFGLAQEASEKGRGLFKAIAYVDVNAEGTTMKFAEDACVNRALPLAVFRSVATAEKWLAGEK
jgi:hypothetical protein